MQIKRMTYGDLQAAVLDSDEVVVVASSGSSGNSKRLLIPLFPSTLWLSLSLSFLASPENFPSIFPNLPPFLALCFLQPPEAFYLLAFFLFFFLFFQSPSFS